MARSDIHRPSVIIPEDYEFVAYEYLGSDGAEIMKEERARLDRHAAFTGAKKSKHDHAGNCHVCGAHAIYLARFYHAKSNSYISTGLDCAAKLEHGNAEDFRKVVKDRLEALKAKQAREAAKAKAKAFLDEKGLGLAWDIHENPANFRSSDEAVLKKQAFAVNTIDDIVGKLVRWGSISANQVSFVARLLNDYRSAETAVLTEAIEKANEQPIPALWARQRRVMIEGKVLAAKEIETQYGTTVKMLVQHTDGWKVWVSKPSSLVYDEVKGRIVRFECNLEISKDDPKFGYGSRPTKAQLID